MAQAHDTHTEGEAASDQTAACGRSRRIPRAYQMAVFGTHGVRRASRTMYPKKKTYCTPSVALMIASAVRIAPAGPCCRRVSGAP